MGRQVKRRGVVGLPLTQKEFNVAYLIAMGLNLKQAALRNSISLSAAQSRNYNVFLKLDVIDRIGLVEWFETQDI